MDIKDLTANTYYKGVDLQMGTGQKIWLFVESTQTTRGPVAGRRDLVVWQFVRKNAGSVWTSHKWINADETTDSGMKRNASLAEIKMDGVPACPADPAAQAATPAPAPALPNAPAPAQAIIAPPPYAYQKQNATPAPKGNLPSQTFAEMIGEKKVEKKNKNEGKVTIPGNAYSKTCIKCSKPTKECILSSTIVYWCPDCEPT